MEKKNRIIFILIVLISIFFVLGIVISVLENTKPKLTEEVVDLGVSLEQIEAHQLGFLFFEDKNVNGEFDYDEKVVKNVSVAVRRPGETAAFITVPAETSGLVKIDNLADGEYEVQYLNYELEQPYKKGEFEFKHYYQIVEAGKVRFSFLPTEWQKINLTDSGFKLKVGMREYLPSSLLVIFDQDRLEFYDPVRNRVLGESQKGISFKFKNSSLYYYQDNSLTRFEIKPQLTKVVIERLFVKNLSKYWLSEDDSGLLFLDDESRWQYESKVLGCKGNLSTGDYENLLGVSGQEMADVIENQLVVWAKTKSQTTGVYLGVCNDKKKVELKRFEQGSLTSLEFLDKETWFYSNDEGSYFFNFSNGQSTKYTALGNRVMAKISEDKKYIGASVNGSTIVVDYPAVKQSGVEKHYVLPFTGKLIFFKDEVLITQSKTCQEDGDCGEIIRISLKGNGVWEIKDRIELKDIQVDGLLGEVLINN